MIRKPRNSHRNASLKVAARRSLRQRPRKLQHERLETRELLALLTSGSGDGHLQVSVNEYGAFGRSGDLLVTTVLNPNGGREIDDAFYDPVGALPRAGTTFESAIALKVGGDPVQFLTAGTVADSGDFNNGAFQTPIDPNQRILRSTFYYPNTAATNGAGATLRIDLFQQVIPRFVSGTTPVGVTLQQQYTITNLSGSAVDVQVFRYYDGDQLFDGNFNNDGAGMRQVIANNPELTWMTNTATNTNLNDPSYVEVRSASTGIVRPNRWEVGLARGVLTTAPTPPYSAANPGKNLPSQAANGALVQKILTGGPLSDDIVRAIQSDVDGNNAVDNGRGADWATALRNFYTIPGGGNTVYLTETQFGDPQIGDVPPPVIPPAQQGVVTGQKFSDRNGNGIIDSGEFGVAGFRIFADANNDGLFNAGEASTITGNGGFYQLTLNVGTYTIREVSQPNWTPTAPALGFYTVTIAAAGDVISNINFGNQAAPSNISGLVFEDFNKNGRLDSGEGGVANAFIYADLNNNFSFELNEPNTTSIAGGTYTLGNLDPGTYIVRQVPPSGYEQTYPSNNGAQIVTTQPGQSLSGINFGDALRAGEVNGKVYFDLNNNGLIDPGEPGAANVIVYVDRDNNCNIGLGENAIVTGASGTFGMLGVAPGTYNVRLSTPAGVEQVLPSGGVGACGAAYTITVLPGQPTGGIDFLVASFGGPGTKDFGDAPFPYPTTLAQNGARATVARDFGLGALQDTELDGQPSPFADNDDFITSPDEDGVQFVDPLRRGQTANIRVTVETGTRSAGRLQGFIDLNQDGDWNDVGERVVSNLVLPTGTHIVPISIPATATFGRTFMRFRYGYEQNLGPTGDSILGEVEDYDVFIVGPNPDAVNDAYSFTDTDIPPFTLNVLSNDIPSENGDVLITSVNTTGTSGTVTVSADGLTISYTPSGTAAFDSFTYTITDPAGHTDTATVSINLLLPPTAVDDAYVFATNVGAVSLNVLANDTAGVPPLTVTAVGTPSAGGTVTIATGGGSLIYTPPVGYAGTETFTYTVTNGANISKTANVTVATNQTADTNNLIEFDIILVELDGITLLPNNPVVGLGQMFLARVTVEDLRTAAEKPFVDQGVAAAYLDLLFDPDKLEVVADPTAPGWNADFGFNINFGLSYPSGQTASDNTPGLLNEAGGFQDENGVPLGPNAFRVFTVTLRAKTTATTPAAGPVTARITTDPADVSPDSDVILFNPLEPPVTVDQMQLDQVLVTIDANAPVDNSFVAAPAPEDTAGSGGGTPANGVTGTGKWHNFNIPTDVNGDGKTSPLDALVIINSLNANGSRALIGSALPLAGTNPAWLDVNGDDSLSPLDALMIINQLNARPSGEAQGEAAVASVSAATSTTVISAATTSESSTVTLQPGQSATLPFAVESSSDEPVSPLSDDSDAGSMVFGSSSSTPEALFFAASTGTDFGASSAGGSDADEEFDLLLDDLAQDTCPQWR